MKNERLKEFLLYYYNLYMMSSVNFKDQFGDREIESINPDEILSFLVQLTEGTKQTTKRNRYSCIKAFSDYLNLSIYRTERF